LVAKLPLGEDQAEAVELIDRSAELLGLPDASVDVVVATLVLCSVTDPARA
jgi:ubiquinone/menaquinone biosynthesis C-methylase UbiE